MKSMLSETALPKEEKGALDLDDEEDDLSDGFVSSGEDDEEIAPAAAGENGRDEEMEEIMEQMDRELGVTEIGKSFEKMKVSMQASSKTYQQPLKPLQLTFLMAVAWMNCCRGFIGR